MNKHHQLLNAVWRQVAQYVDIEESALQISTLVKRLLPRHTMIVFRYRAEDGALDRVVPLATELPLQSAPHQLPLTPDERADLTQWTRGEDPLMRHTISGEPVRVPRLSLLSRMGIPHGAECLVGPLVDAETLTGLLVLVALPPKHFEPEHEAIAERLLEPLSAALKNDSRLHEIEIMRNAAESERLAALRRLGRDRVNDDIIGVHGGLKSVVARVGKVARTDMPVLILGETGTGKEVIARLVHEQSSRAGGPFLRVNCGAIAPDLLDSELFGHERGSFTGATSARRGWFDRADGGTLLLDEIGELGKPGQVRLLRVLQDGSFERVGGEKTVHVDVRVVAATHRDLPAMVQEGLFREDLWYRISGFPVVLPPLRERRQDILNLARHFSERAARVFGLMLQYPTEEDLAVLKSYRWPGNIRELASVIDRAAILGEGKRLEIRRALGAVSTASAPTNGKRTNTPRQSEEAAAVDGFDTLAESMRMHIESALTLARGQIEGQRGAARLLDLNPHTLRAKMRRLGIEWAAFRVGGS